MAAGLGFCQDLNLLSVEPADVVATCNTIYGLLLQVHWWLVQGGVHRVKVVCIRLGSIHIADWANVHRTYVVCATI